jgi:hypothetical protein
MFRHDVVSGRLQNKDCAAKQTISAFAPESAPTQIDRDVLSRGTHQGQFLQRIVAALWPFVVAAGTEKHVSYL